MKRLWVLPAFCLLVVSASAQQSKSKAAAGSAKTTATAANGYSIPATITPLKNCWLYMGCYFGKFKNLVDSAWVDGNSNAVFKGKKKLPGGIYFLVSPRKAILFDFLVDEQQHFSIKADTLQPDKAVVTGSPDNDLFQAYSAFLAQKMPHINELQGNLKSAKTAADFAAIRAELQKSGKELNDYRDQVIATRPESMMAVFFQAMKRPEAPPVPTLPNGTKDSLYPLHYVHDHYFDGIDFNDERLLHTPFLDPKVEEYFKYYVVPHPDTLIQEVNYLLLSSRANDDIHRYWLGRFTDKYINPEIMGQDKVFIFLFNQYFSKGDTTWLNPKQREFIFNRAYSMMANQIDEPAPVLDLKDSSNKVTPLYNVKAPFTFVVFWDPTCSHCKVQVPEVDSMYEAKWKKMGVKIYAVNVEDKDDVSPAWKKFIQDNHLNGWVHVYQPKAAHEADNKAGRANFRQLYDVFQTPTMYLLDANKNIIGKKLTLEQFDQVMQAKIKAQKASGAGNAKK
ncbi:TlpA family protein disulfide reductase [Deminuibacter soli]|uniref:DUF5106 domain-containing protein n=1 Tax=Deminuibacter soli TaxID=2291815 RepID=A0A3E1NQN4_9BACT|nr:TlpA family protein disulfide reductase [Deminuibacter soli]RFM30220.1 DUF5106 domain-containing protein [Deminuibacter soli]